MKTQLLQDFQESGSTAATPPSPPKRPAVWHGPGAHRADAGAAVQRADPGPMQRAPDTPARGKGVAIEAWAERAAQARPPRPAPPAADATVPDQNLRQRPPPPPRPPEPPPGAERPAAPDHAPPPLGPGTIPRPTQPDAEAEWLAARMREETAARDAPAWSSAWKRRLVTWSIAGGLLAGLAAGGLWLYEENRVEGALVVVANTSPAGQVPAAPVFAAGAPAPMPAPAPVPAPAFVAPDPVKPLPEPAPPVVEDKAPVAAEPANVTPPRRTPRNRPTERKRITAKARRAPTQDAAPVAAEPSPQRRREETLMQCRAHGYDARQCIERACTMTRFGLACKG
jgi:hypothetical protein